MGGKDSAAITVLNKGTANLTSSIGVIGSSTFTTSLSNINIIPGDSVKVFVFFKPLSQGIVTATIRFNTNDPSHSTVDVGVTGTGVPTVGVRESENIPSLFMLNQNYPNPFNPSTKLEFSVPSTGWTTLKVYNAVGQHVSTLYHGIAEAGKYHQVTFSAEANSGIILSSGIYFARLTFSTETGEAKQMMKKMMLIK